MAKITIKGHEFDSVSIKDSFHRRAVQSRNKIIDCLRKLGLTEDDADIPVEKVAIKKVPASASWYLEGYHLHFSYSAGNNFAENIYVVFKVIEMEVNLLIEEQKTINEFISDFSEDKDIKEQREWARETLGLEKNELNFESINEKYKSLAKESHPDMPGGDVAKFKEINRAHKILKRELQ